MSLYNLKSDDGQWRITKFDNGLNVESSYLTSLEGCECPAGARPTCRHRTMLPRMLNVGAENSGMFYDFDADQFLEPLSDAEDTQPVIVSPVEPETEARSALSTSSPSSTEPNLDKALETIMRPGFGSGAITGRFENITHIEEVAKAVPSCHPSIGAIKRKI